MIIGTPLFNLSIESLSPIVQTLLHLIWTILPIVINIGIWVWFIHWLIVYFGWFDR